MWNHEQNCSVFGDDDGGEKHSSLKDKVERSLDLKQYLKYLDPWFTHTSSDSDSSVSEEEDNRTFTKFLHPPAQASERSASVSQHQYNLQGSVFQRVSQFAKLSNSNSLSNFSALNCSDGLHSLEANISSSPVSSVDSGTSSLSYNLATDFFPEVKLAKVDNNGNSHQYENAAVISTLKSQHLSQDSSCDPSSNEDENGKSEEAKSKKRRKRKKTSKDCNKKIFRQYKPNVAGNSNSNSDLRGGAFTRISTSRGELSFSNSESLKAGSVAGSVGGKYNSGFKNVPINAPPLPDILNEGVLASINSVQNELTPDSLEEHFSPLISDSSEDFLLIGNLAEKLASDFLTSRGNDDGFDSLPLSAILDISEEENSLNDYISTAAPVNTQATPFIVKPSVFPSSTKSFDKVADSTLSNNLNVLLTEHSPESLTSSSEKKRKSGSSDIEIIPDKLTKLSENQKQSRIDYLNAKRKKIYVYICRKEIGKAHRARASLIKEGLAANRKLALACERHFRKKAQQSEKCAQESVCKAKRLTQEMEMHWKMAEKAEREFQRMKEKEVEEQRRKEQDLLSRQIKAEKFSQLITHIESFAEDILKNDKDSLAEEQLQSLDPRRKEIMQSQIFDSALKIFQVKGLDWMQNLYVRGLHGILADEPGLGKKVQVIAFLSQLVKYCELLGPLLIVSPSSSIEKWLQIFSQIAPTLNIMSYSGKPKERNILRRFAEKNDLHKKDINVHVVLTSYQNMVSELKYFSNVQWQYLILDDSHGAIVSSPKWVSLLSFRCRNKLMLSDSPLLNSGLSLCSYIYFVMPSLFDTYEPFSEWFIREIDSPTMTNGEIDEKSLMRLRSVVHKFLLRRTREGVEESDTGRYEDIQVICTLSSRQHNIYSNLLEKSNISQIADAMDNSTLEDKTLLKKKVFDLLKQLQKTCNHPDLIQKHERKFPLWMNEEYLVLPELIFENGQAFAADEYKNVSNDQFSIYECVQVHNSLFKGANQTLENVTKNVLSSSWSFSRLLGLSCGEVEDMYKHPFPSRLNHLVNFESVLERLIFESEWKFYGCTRVNFMQYPSMRLHLSLKTSELLKDLVFTSSSSQTYAWGGCKIYSVPEPIEYRALRSRTKFSGLMNASKISEPSRVSQTNSIYRSFQPLEIPKFIMCYNEKIISGGFISKVLNPESKHNSDSDRGSLIPGETDWNKCLLNMIPTSNSSCHDKDNFFTDSGKLQRLHEVLTRLKIVGRKVLLCSHSLETIVLLEEFLTDCKIKYVKMKEGLGQWHPDVSIFILYIQGFMPSTSTPPVPVDAVVIFDQNWNGNENETKKMISEKLVCPTRVNYYQFVSKDTIEERMLEALKQRNAILDNNDVSYNPPWKSLISIIKSEYNRFFSGNAISKKQGGSLESTKLYLNAFVRSIDGVNLSAEQKIYYQQKKLLDFMNGNKGSDSVSTSTSSCSEGQESDEVERELSLKECSDFAFNFEDGYMGMSPSYFDDSNYEYSPTPNSNKIERSPRKRGRPPSRSRLQKSDLGDGSVHHRGPGRPRLKPIGPANQGLRGRKPGRPPLTRKTETITSSLPSLESRDQRVFGFYSSVHLDFS